MSRTPSSTAATRSARGLSELHTDVLRTADRPHLRLGRRHPEIPASFRVEGPTSTSSTEGGGIFVLDGSKGSASLDVLDGTVMMPAGVLTGKSIDTSKVGGGTSSWVAFNESHNVATG
ncbi:MAG: hypothetical protein M3O84_06880 [Actinomycetota bacterium]|nr:hypothetical protein [Actinomycetota bacterium]